MDATAVFLFLLQLVHVFGDQRVSYDNYRIYDVYQSEVQGEESRIPENENVRLLKRRHQFDENQNVFSVKTYLVPGSEEKDFVKTLNAEGLLYNVSVQDLGKSIEEERINNERQKRTYGDTFLDHGRYFTYDNMTTYLNYIKKFQHPETKEDLVEVEIVGKSTEGRNLYLVKISSSFKASKPIVLFEAGMHGREWTSPCAALYMISQLVEEFDRNRHVLKKVNYYVMPMVNPDGYEYSRTVDRMWRKTRSHPHGVDGNRNFGFHWGEEGASSRPESEVYKGPRAFSEPETRAVRDMGIRYQEQDRLRMFISIHAFGPYIIYPWSYQYKTPAPLTNEMHAVARQAAIAMQKFSGTNYIVGTSAETMYLASGGSDDYFKGEIGLDMAFTVELSHADTFSFIVPNNKLLDICREAFIGFKTLAKHA